MLKHYRAKYAASRSSSESSERFVERASSSKLGSDALKYNAIGRYTVESKELDEEYDAPYSYMSLNITKTDADGFVAFFRISGITGIMLLDTDEEDLYFRWLDKRYEGEDESASEDDGAQEDVKGGQFIDTKASGEMLDHGNQRSQEVEVKLEDHQDPDDNGNDLFSIQSSGLKRESTASPTPDGQMDSKRQDLPTVTTSKHDTLFLMWRGRASHEREIQVDPAGDYFGHIKFLDEECSHYEGVFYDTWTIQEITIKGKKVSQEPGTPGENWASLSKRVWEEEGGAIW